MKGFFCMWYNYSCKHGVGLFGEIKNQYLFSNITKVGHATTETPN